MSESVCDELLRSLRHHTRSFRIANFSSKHSGTAAAFAQSYAYGAFTPAGGIFATLTSMAMLGTLMPAAALVAGILATVVAFIVWACGVGR